MAHMQRAGHVGRRQHDAEALVAGLVRAPRSKCARVQPFGGDPRLLRLSRRMFFFMPIAHLFRFGCVFSAGGGQGKAPLGICAAMGKIADMIERKPLSYPRLIWRLGLGWLALPLVFGVVFVAIALSSLAAYRALQRDGVLARPR